MPPVGLELLLAPSEEKSTLQADLIAIARHVVTNRRQFSLLQHRAHRNLKHKGRAKETVRIVSSLKSEILSLEKVDFKTGINSENHERYDNLLSGGLGELNKFKRRSEEKAKLAAEEEIKAREDDRQDLREFLRKIQTQVSLVQLPKILIYRMEEPHGPPIELQKQWTKYRILLGYLMGRRELKHMTTPEIWIRREATHSLTPCGRSWEFANVREEIKEMRLDVVDGALYDEYMVALVHEDDREIPVPIEVPKHSYHKNTSLILKDHLDRIWTSRTIVSACLIKNPEDDTVLCEKLDTSCWTPRTNELYVRCEPKVS